MPAAARADHSASGAQIVGDSAFDPSSLEHSLLDRASPWGLRWRRRAMVVAALVACVALFALARWFAGTPQVDASWAVGPAGQLVLESSRLPQLQVHQGQIVAAISSAGQTPLAVDALLLQHSLRWQPDDTARQRQLTQHRQIAAWLGAGALRLHFVDGSTADVGPAGRGYRALGPSFWPLAGLALLLYLFGVVVLLAKPRARSLLYGTAALCQAIQLMIFALEGARGLALPPALLALEPTARLALDACTGAAIVHGFALQPRRLMRARHIALWTWLAAAAGTLALPWVQSQWIWSQVLCLGLGAAAVAVMGHSVRLEPNPYALVMRRLASIALATLTLVTAAVAIYARLPGVSTGVAEGAVLAWYLFLASLLLLTPFLARSRQVLREFSLLAGISTVAASADLLFVSVFSLGPFVSLAMAVFAALAIYAGARQVILNRMLGRSRLTTERTFEQLYRAARELQAHPQQQSQLLRQLLADLFEPLELVPVQARLSRARVLGGGSALVVPMGAAVNPARTEQALALRFAQRGQRLFTLEDARLADRVVDQLRRAVAYDQAVEQGRLEERLRIAQDLHDDIGARLLTLMYRAGTPEMEDYIRHTLQDLKTLTRGLAAADHRLSHAAAEWKADLTQRLAAAQVQLSWSCSYEQDLNLSMVQWSALTRVLRELASNVLAHGQASQVEVELQFQGPGLWLRVADDGCGRAPEAWSHGLGLGGVRKRIKLLGGSVEWRENEPHGIVCEAQVPDLGRHD